MLLRSIAISTCFAFASRMDKVGAQSVPPSCLPGTFFNSSNKSCDPCPQGTYTDKPNLADHCNPCSSCTEGRETTSKCEKWNNTKCDCQLGDYDTGQGCKQVTDDMKQLFEQTNTQLLELLRNNTCKACLSIESYINATMKSLAEQCAARSMPDSSSASKETSMHVTCDSYPPAVAAAVIAASILIMLTLLIPFMLRKVQCCQTICDQRCSCLKTSRNTDGKESRPLLAAGSSQAVAGASTALPHGSDHSQAASSTSTSVSYSAGTLQGVQDSSGSAIHASGSAPADPSALANVAQNAAASSRPESPVSSANTVQGAGSTQGVQAAPGNGGHVSGSTQGVQAAPGNGVYFSGSPPATPALSANFANVAGLPQTVQAASGNVQGAGAHQRVQTASGNVGNSTGPAQVPQTASLNASQQAGSNQTTQVAATTVGQGSATY